MGKSPFWLRGARGKFAGSVLYKGENGTIIRENVRPSNPKTTPQMMTRICFGTLATAASWLQRIVGQTFEGSASMKVNKRKFMAENFPVLRAQAMNDYAGGGGGGDMRGAFLPKGMRILVPNAYVISNGSVVPSKALRLSVTGNYGEEEFTSITSEMSLTVGATYTAAQLWRGFFDLEPGQQATLVLIDTKNGEDVAFDYGSVSGKDDPGLSIVRYGDMSAARLVLLSGEGDSITIAAGTTKAEILACMESLIDLAKTATALWNITGNTGFPSIITYTDNKLSMTASDVLSEFSESEYEIKAAGWIISELRNNGWAYSRTVMAQIAPAYHGENHVAYDNAVYGLYVTDAIATYLGGETTSDKYTQQGGSENTIGNF